ncbi:hypothetical protein BSNK01_11600 [Bacillaceae bacterium]
MSEGKLEQFQQQVSDLLLRHRSILDVVSKFQESNARVNRALMKAVTDCGCLEVRAKRQCFAQDMTLQEVKEHLSTHLFGQLCENCRDIVKAELGKNLFYMTAVCNLLNIPLREVLESEASKLSTLGVFNFS